MDSKINLYLIESHKMKQNAYNFKGELNVMKYQLSVGKAGLE